MPNITQCGSYFVPCLANDCGLGVVTIEKYVQLAICVILAVCGCVVFGGEVIYHVVEPLLPFQATGEQRIDVPLVGMVHFRGYLLRVCDCLDANCLGYYRIRWIACEPSRAGGKWDYYLLRVVRDGSICMRRKCVPSLRSTVVMQILSNLLSLCASVSIDAFCHHQASKRSRKEGEALGERIEVLSIPSQRLARGCLIINQNRKWI